MTHPRRKFLKSATQAAGALVLTSFGANLVGCSSSKRSMGGASNAANGAASKPFGLQLYTLRDELPKDPKGVLQQVASFGYKQIEGYEGPKGIFWGMSHTEFKKYMDDLGLQFISSHCNTKDNFEQKCAQAAEIGMKYLIHPYLGPQKSLDEYKKAADYFNTRAEICRKAGIRFAYHNHDYSFKPMDGQFPQDVFMQNTDSASMDYEMDIYWVVTAGQDPAAWFAKYPGRFKLGHVKDRRKGTTEVADSVVIGTGSIDFATLLPKAKAAGMDYFIVEQERYDGTTPLKATQDDAEAMRHLPV